MRKKKWLTLVFAMFFFVSASFNAVLIKRDIELKNSLEDSREEAYKLLGELNETELKVAQYIDVVKDKDGLIEEQHSYIEDVQSQLEELKEQVENLNAK